MPRAHLKVEFAQTILRFAPPLYGTSLAYGVWVALGWALGEHNCTLPLKHLMESFTVSQGVPTPYYVTTHEKERNLSRRATVPISQGEGEGEGEG